MKQNPEMVGYVCSVYESLVKGDPKRLPPYAYSFYRQVTHLKTKYMQHDAFTLAWQIFNEDSSDKSHVKIYKTCNGAGEEVRDVVKRLWARLKE